MGAKKMGEREEIKIRITTKIKSASRSISMSARESEMKRTWSGIRGLGSRPDSTAHSALKVSPSHGTYIEAVTPVPLLGTSAVGEAILNR